MFRIAWIAVLLLSVVVRPLLVGISETDESSHRPVSGHACETDIADTTAVPSSTVGDTDQWHALIHAVHCCGCASALPASAAQPMTAMRTSPSHVDRQPRWSSARAAQPLRPPIIVA